MSRVQQALRAAGVEAGDRVVAWLPNAPEVYALMLGAASIGAAFSSTSPDFGVDGVVDRFGQIEPTVLVAADGYHYNGKWFDCRARLQEITDGLPSLQTVVTDWDEWLAPVRGTARSSSNRCRSTTRGTSSSRRAPPARRSASCTAPAACC